MMAPKWTPLPSVARWTQNCERWSGQTGVPVPLLLAFIHQESGGNPNAIRFEREYMARYCGANSRGADIAHRCHMSTDDVATSYGLMQLMFPVAYGFGARSVHDVLLPDNNIRFGAAHVATLIHRITGGNREIGISDVLSIAAAYNGCKTSDSYPRCVVSLYQRYDAWRRGE